MIKVYFPSILPDGVSPSQRFRIEQFIPYLKMHDISIDSYPFFNNQSAAFIYKNGNIVGKAMAFVAGFGRRLLQLKNAYQADYIYIQRDVIPLGPAIFEWIYKVILKKKIIFDYDDAIWLPSTSSSIFNKLKSYSRVAKLIKWSTAIAAGNQYLLEYALKYNKNAQLIPTVVDTNSLHNQLKMQNTPEVVVGWTGTFSTNFYFNQLEDLLLEIQKEFPIKVIAISNKKPEFKKIEYEYIEWGKHSEIDDLLKINIGLMPLNNGPWEQGKCAFKAIQFMALGIPVVASKVGANTKVIAHGVDSFLYETQQEFLVYLKQLIANEALRIKMGAAARNKINQQFSVQSNLQKVIQLFN
jgi:glycosyltransferase involved in cell wall biosynthesis